jgi:hypothetical protein
MMNWLMIIFISLFSFSAFTRISIDFPTVLESEGEVYLVEDSLKKSKELEVGHEWRKGEVIFLKDQGRVKLMMPDGSLLEMGPYSVVKLTSSKIKMSEIELIRGFGKWTSVSTTHNREVKIKGLGTDKKIKLNKGTVIFQIYERLEKNCEIWSLVGNHKFGDQVLKENWGITSSKDGEGLFKLGKIKNRSLDSLWQMNVDASKDYNFSVKDYFKQGRSLASVSVDEDGLEEIELDVISVPVLPNTELKRPEFPSEIRVHESVYDLVSINVEREAKRFAEEAIESSSRTLLNELAQYYLPATIYDSGIKAVNYELQRQIPTIVDEVLSAPRPSKSIEYNKDLLRKGSLDMAQGKIKNLIKKEFQLYGGIQGRQRGKKIIKAIATPVIEQGLLKIIYQKTKSKVMPMTQKFMDEQKLINQEQGEKLVDYLSYKAGIKYGKLVSRDVIEKYAEKYSRFYTLSILGPMSLEVIDSLAKKKAQFVADTVLERIEEIEGREIASKAVDIYNRETLKERPLPNQRHHAKSNRLRLEDSLKKANSF